MEQTATEFADYSAEKCELCGCILEEKPLRLGVWCVCLACYDDEMAEQKASDAEMARE